jgi:hypothetical protein
MAQTDEAIAKYGATFVKDMLKTKPLSYSVDYLNKVVEMHKQLEDKIYKQQELGLQKRRLDMEQQKQTIIGATANGEKLILMSPTGEITTKDAPKDVDLAKLVKPGEKPGKQPGAFGATAFLNSVLGGSTGTLKSDQEVVNTALGVSQLNHVIKLFKDPEVQTGVVSKLAPIREKLASLGDNNHEITEDEFKRIVDGEISPNAKNAVAQKEALFAAYTAEREIAGGRLLVSVVKQAGGALDPTNYEKEGYLNLLNSRQNELKKRLHGQMLSDDQIDSVVENLDEGTSGHVLSGKNNAAPALERGTDDKGSFHWEYNADRTKRRKVYD